ncbi:MAG TPA: hypothetical protein VF721_20175 [Pyrinomonadaceae bacterium]|jgi:hypothetical protein
MTKHAHTDESDWAACEGGSEEAGKSINPKNLPAEEDAPASPNEHRAVSIGLPVSTQKYNELKEAAEKDKPPPGKKGQVDPST